MHRNYENLVFEGGSVKGILYSGVIKELDQVGVLSSIKRFAGTSIGALFASLLAVGFTSDEILALVPVYCDVTKLADNSNCVQNIFHIFQHFGINDTKNMEQQFRALFNHRINPDITLKELYEKTNKELVIVSCSLMYKKPVYFHHTTFPNVKLIDAVIASMSIPFIFYPRKIENDSYVDGGIVDNFPMWVFNDINKLATGSFESIDRKILSPSTLGIKLITKSLSDVNQDNTKISSIVSYTMSLLNTIMFKIENIDINPLYADQVIPIYTETVYFVDFTLSKKTVKNLINTARKNVRKYYGLSFDDLNIIDEEPEESPVKIKTKKKKEKKEKHVKKEIEVEV